MNSLSRRAKIIIGIVLGIIVVAEIEALIKDVEKMIFLYKKNDPALKDIGNAAVNTCFN